MTIEELKAKVPAGDFIFVGHHACALCEEMVGYEVFSNNVYFNSGCGCSRATIVSERTFEEVVAFINQHNSGGF